ncbi:MAG: hypoxanthine phosphoribosyltransferase, partial [Oscillospiraceae bacterium]|nr:hypoxanthine phosphoribosyltransferase [Oscillospiraceae bacterium]
LLVSILKGSVVFMSDLMRSITIPCSIDFMAVSSYGSGVKTSGVVKIVKDLDIDLKGWDVLVVEDILDSGLTLSYIWKLLRARSPKSIRLCTLFDKPDRRSVDISADYVGAVVPDEFIVGYGLDYAQKYRNLPFVGILKPKVYGG